LQDLRILIFTQNTEDKDDFDHPEIHEDDVKKSEGLLYPLISIYLRMAI